MEKTASEEAPDKRESSKSQRTKPRQGTESSETIHHTAVGRPEAHKDKTNRKLGFLQRFAASRSEGGPTPFLEDVERVRICFSYSVESTCVTFIDGSLVRILPAYVPS